MSSLPAHSQISFVSYEHPIAGPLVVGEASLVRTKDIRIAYEKYLVLPTYHIVVHVHWVCTFLVQIFLHVVAFPCRRHIFVLSIWHREVIPRFQTKQSTRRTFKVWLSPPHIQPPFSFFEAEQS